MRRGVAGWGSSARDQGAAVGLIDGEAVPEREGRNRGTGELREVTVKLSRVLGWLERGCSGGSAAAGVHRR